MNRKIVWYDGRNLKQEKAILPLVCNYSYDHLVIDSGAYSKIRLPRKMKLILDMRNNEKLSKEFEPNAILMAGDADKLRTYKQHKYKTAYYQRIENQDDMDKAWKIGRLADYLVVEITSETNIPLELLIARLQKTETVLLKKVDNIEDAKVALGVMEVGSDGILLSSEDIQEIVAVHQYMVEAEKGKLSLEKAKVTDVCHVGSGSRACIDCTDIMQQNEGMVVGSTSVGGIIVSSETHFLPYMDLRPFRVNAGAIHSYVWAPTNMTAYLSELKAGSRVLCVDTYGNTRVVTVGRVKIEVRPLLKIEAEVQGIRINAIVQDDWHIRIFGGDGSPLNASSIKIGDEVLAYFCPAGRHVGIKVDETIDER